MFTSLFRQFAFQSAAVLLFLMAFCPCTLAESWTRQLSDGVILTQTITRPSDKADAAPSRIVNILRIDPRTPGVRVQAALGQGKVYGSDKLKGRETAGAMAKRLGAVAVVNAGYFWQSGDPLGLHISGGELISEPYPKRAAFGISADGSLIFDQLEFEAHVALPDGRTYPIKGINRPQGKSELVVYTSKFGESTYEASDATQVVVRCTDPWIVVGVPTIGTVADLRCSPTGMPIAEGTLVLSGTGEAASFLQNLTQGTGIELRSRLKSFCTAGWENVTEAVGGGPWLVRNGSVYIDAAEQGIKPDISKGANARTAVGATADGALVIATVSGWKRSGGMTLEQLAELMKSQGCVNAINLDGGGSTTLANSLGVLNLPSDVAERYVADAIVILPSAEFGVGSAELGSRVGVTQVSGDRHPELASRSGETRDTKSPIPPDTHSPIPSDVLIAAPEGPIPAGSSCQFVLTDASGNAVGPGLSGRAVWSASGAVGFIDQSGRLYAIRARKGKVAVKVDSLTAEIPIEVAAGIPDEISAKFEVDPSGAPNRRMLSISLSDRNGNPIPGQRVSIKVTGGIPDQGDGITDSEGRVQVGITLDDAGAGKLSACIETLAAQPSTTKPVRKLVSD